MRQCLFRFRLPKTHTNHGDVMLLQFCCTKNRIPGSCIFAVKQWGKETDPPFLVQSSNHLFFPGKHNGSN